MATKDNRKKAAEPVSAGEKDEAKQLEKNKKAQARAEGLIQRSEKPTCLEASNLLDPDWRAEFYADCESLSALLPKDAAHKKALLKVPKDEKPESLKPMVIVLKAIVRDLEI